MLSKLSRFIERHLRPSGVSTGLSHYQKQLAVAALLIEVAMADQHFSDEELDSLSVSLKQKYSLSNEEITELVSLAKGESNHATSLHQFTQIVNQHCEDSEKFDLIKAMWELAFADGNLDKYEDYLIRKVAELIYLSHSDVIRGRNSVRSTISKQ